MQIFDKLPRKRNTQVEDSKILLKSSENMIPRTIREVLSSSIKIAVNALLSVQNSDGHWRFDLDCFIFPTAFHIITLGYIGHEIEPETRRKFGNYLRRCQLPTGGWGFVPNGEIVLSNSVVTYLALKLLGDTENEEHMIRAKNAILRTGGIEASNFKTRFNLALFDIVPWSCIPCMPVELIFLPNWFPFNIYKLSYWARTALVPMIVLATIRRPARNLSHVHLDELFIGKPAQMPPVPRAIHQNFFLFHTFSFADIVFKSITRFIPAGIRKNAISAAVTFCTERLNGLDGLGAISPPMNYVLMMFDALGYDLDHPDRVMAKRAQDTFLIVKGEEAYTVACFSPVWDTANIIGALLETGDPKIRPAVENALEWLRPRQILDTKGDWAVARPELRPGGWAFYYRNPHYPDTDDTAVVLSAMSRMAHIEDANAVSRGTEWLLGMQSKNGGWASYDAENCHTYLNSIPAADRGSFVDPPTVDVTGSCLTYLVEAGYQSETFKPIRRAVKFILDSQESNGSWWGRWGVNYIYGTRMAICSLTAAGVALDHSSIVKGTRWLLSVQNEDGGWGESVVSYVPGRDGGMRSTASQTAWAVLGLMAGLGEEHTAITLGIQYLIRTQNEAGFWDEEEFTGTGHPNILYLNYLGYSKYFPLLALARYRKLNYSMTKK